MLTSMGHWCWCPRSKNFETKKRGNEFGADGI